MGVAGSYWLGFAFKIVDIWDLESFRDAGDVTADFKEWDLSMLFID